MNNAKRQRANETRRQNLISRGYTQVKTGLWAKRSMGVNKHSPSIAGFEGYIWAQHGIRGAGFAAAHIIEGRIVPVNTILTAEELAAVVQATA